VAESCAPSLHLTGFGLVPHLETLLANGYVVASTDYPGLGSIGTHPYLVGVSEARAVLDAVRAARTMRTGANAHFVVWGHSQGGQAALFTGQIAATYAPELTIEGVAAVAPATDLLTLMKDDISERGGRILGSYAVWSWTRVYGLPISQVVKPNAVWIVNRVARECVQSTFEAIGVLINSALLRQSFIDSKVYTDPAWRAHFIANTPSAMPASIPLMVVQGRNDVTVRPAVTRQYAARACARGQKVTYDSIPGGHLGAADVSATTVIGWIGRRFGHAAQVDDCASLGA
jgi:acetyl esterase/lipase